MQNQTLQYIIATQVLIIAYFVSKEITGNNILQLAVSALFGVIGFLIAMKLSRQNKNIQIGTIGLLFVSMVISFFLLSNRSDNQLLGTWETDNSGNYAIRMRVSADSAFLSYSPEFQEVGYAWNYERDTLVLSRGGEDVFKWSISHYAIDKLVVESDDDKVVFHKRSR